MVRRILRAAALLWACLASAPAAAAAPADVPTAWRLLDYLAVDYAGAVRDGKVVSASEYTEMREFAGTVSEKLAALPAKPAKPALIADGVRLQQLIDRKAAPAQVATVARALGADLLQTYPLPLGPKEPPDLARGAQLFQQNCASCHGEKGDAQTAMARQLNP